MDPNAALVEALAIAREHQTELDDETLSNHADTGRLADLFLGLHDWLASGGMLPAAWHLSTCMAHDCRVGESAATYGGE